MRLGLSSKPPLARLRFADEVECLFRPRVFAAELKAIAEPAAGNTLVEEHVERVDLTFVFKIFAEIIFDLEARCALLALADLIGDDGVQLFKGLDKRVTRLHACSSQEVALLLVVPTESPAGNLCQLGRLGVVLLGRDRDRRRHLVRIREGPLELILIERGGRKHRELTSQYGVVSLAAAENRECRVGFSKRVLAGKVSILRLEIGEAEHRARDVAHHFGLDLTSDGEVACLFPELRKLFRREMLALVLRSRVVKLREKLTAFLAFESGFCVKACKVEREIIVGGLTHQRRQLTEVVSLAGEVGGELLRLFTRGRECVSKPFHERDQPGYTFFRNRAGDRHFSVRDFCRLTGFAVGILLLGEGSFDARACRLGIAELRSRRLRRGRCLLRFGLLSGRRHLLLDLLRLVPKPLVFARGLRAIELESDC